MRQILFSLVLVFSVTACVSTPTIEHPVPEPHFDAIAFFSGPTIGTGRLKKILSGPEKTIVHGSGRVDGDTLVLDQTVEEGTKPAKFRTWRIHRDAPNHYSGTLTDATGQITGDVEGNRLHLAFTMKGGFATDQWLTLAADGRSAHNVMVVRKLGLEVAVLDEVIRKVDQL